MYSNDVMIVLEILNFRFPPFFANLCHVYNYNKKLDSSIIGLLIITSIIIMIIREINKSAQQIQEEIAVAVQVDPEADEFEDALGE